MTVGHIGFVGTGRMGTAMIRRISGAGFELTVYNRTRQRAEAVAADTGVAVAGSAREVAATADVVLVSLADDAAVHAAYGGPDGIVAGLRESARSGVVVADTSTISPAAARLLAGEVKETGGTLLDSPVSGSVPTVEQGGLTIMVGGDSGALDTVRPVFEPIATRIVHLGPNGTGATMKLALNSIVHALNVALSEALVLAEAAGIERSAAYEVIENSAAAAPFVHYKRTAFLDPDATPVAFSLDLVAKDLELAADLARESGVSMRQLAASREVVARAIDGGFGDADLSAIAQHLRAPSP
jgi:3-hydroxyisobutyrate dehydrogenase-like beta-hydroxyacid dehydrogenase